ncbi:MAG: thiamine pyrophosphate-dependent dehydrogenase E1 component subunit alpha [Clostridiales Family XIII bacterium]|jgi:pyruvate dehydrogenase E1 component alpha subunit|nr:thiamine pyrophosphate-dependent dehydrogenase E1 component subunit alpha [Clostridiales Family XIII bacterium]
MRFSNEELLDMYDDIVLARVLGEKIVEYIFSGKIAGSIHPCLGQEAVSAGLIAAFKKSGIKNYGTGTHRSQTVMAYRVGLKNFIGELLCRTGGENGGISGEYHLTNVEKTMIPATGALGGTWGLLAGVAWALKAGGKTREIAFAPYGDGAVSQGSTYEAMNIAALYQLPILFFIENNGIAMSTPVNKQSPLENLADRASAFNMQGVTVDGNDPIAVAEAVLEGMELAANFVPNVVEAKTVRWEGHYVGDDQSLYRDVSFRKHLDDIDPVLHFTEKLKGMGLLDEETVVRVLAEKTALVESTFDEQLQFGLPTREQALDYNRIYSNEAGGEL